MKRPLECLAGGFVLGEVLALLPVGWMAGILAAFLAGVCYLRKKCGRSLVWRFLPVFCLWGMIWHKGDLWKVSRYEEIAEAASGKEVRAEGTLAGIWERNGGDGLTLKLTEVVIQGEESRRRYGNILVYLDGNGRSGTDGKGQGQGDGGTAGGAGKLQENGDDGEERLRIGERIQAEGSLERPDGPKNPGEFDFCGYYHAIGIEGRFFAEEMARLHEGYSPCFDGIYRLKCRAGQILDRICEEGDRGVFKAMVLGEKAELSADIKKLYQRSGISHLLAISGLHVSMIGLGCYGFMRKMGLGFWGAGAAGMTAAAGYGVLAGGMGIPASVFRAVIMVVMQMLADCLGRTYDRRTGIALSGMVLLLWSPQLLFQAGFQLSFGAVLALAVAEPLAQRWLGVRKGWQKTLLAGAAVQLATCPVIAFHYFEYPVYGFFLNLAVIPLMSYVLLSGIFGVAFGWVEIRAGMAATGTGHYVLELYRRLCEKSQELPGAVMVTGRPGAWQMAAYGAMWCGFLAVMAIKTGDRGNEGEETGRKPEGRRDGGELRESRGAGEELRRRRRAGGELRESRDTGEELRESWDTGEDLRRSRDIGEDLRESRGAGGAWSRRAFAVLFAGASLAVLLFRFPERGMEVTFLDVGQGDGICIRAEGAVVLVDGGSTDKKTLGAQVLEPFLKSRGISRVDYAIVSHGDRDHISGLMELMEEDCGIEIGHVILPWLGQGGEDEIYGKIEQAARRHRAKVAWMKRGDGIRAGQMAIDCLYAGEERAESFGREDRNEHSLMLQVRYGMAGFLLTGDMSAAGEKQWLKLGERPEIQVLKVAHHGSSYSTEEEFLERIGPAWAVISCGEGNRYGHPGGDVLERLENQGVRWCATMETGAVTIKTDGRRMEVRKYLENRKRLGYNRGQRRISADKQEGEWIHERRRRIFFSWRQVYPGGHCSRAADGRRDDDAKAARAL